MSNSSDHKGTTHGEFSVSLFFESGHHLYEKRLVGAEEAVKCFYQHCLSPAARLGVTNEVRLTDGNDHCNIHWQWFEGIVFPLEHTGLFAQGIDNRKDDAGGRSGVRESGPIPYSTDGSGRADHLFRDHDGNTVESGEATQTREGSRGDDTIDEG